MTDVQHKIVSLFGLNPIDPPAIAGLRPNSIMNHASQRAVGAAQDAVCGGSRRVLGTIDVSGSAGFHVPASGAPVSQADPLHSFPDREGWRTAGLIRIPRLTPGCFLQARILHVGSGQTQILDGANWEPAGSFGAIRFTTSWASGSDSDGPTDIDLELPPSLLADAAAPADDAGVWIALEVTDAPTLRPDLSTDALMADFTDELEVVVEVQYRGSPRVVALALYEEPLFAAFEHDDVGPHAINGQSTYETNQTTVPQETAADGATYGEERFGTHRMLSVAQRQQEVIGPVVMSLQVWNESLQDDNLDVEPVIIGSTSLVNILDTSQTSYDRDLPGFVCAAAHAQVHYLSEPVLVIPGGVASVVPGRVRVEARLRGAATAATIRVQSGDYEWIDIEVTSSSWTVLDATGYFETQVTPDHAWAIVQVFSLVDRDTVEIRSVVSTFGE